MCSNLPPGGVPEPREHDRRCASRCNSVVEPDGCYWGHFDHACDCADIADADAEAMAEAQAEHLADMADDYYRGLH